MGLDGGTYITRSDVLRGQSWAVATSDTSRSTRGGVISSAAVYQPKRLEPTAERAVKWSTCALTGQPLQRPIAADYLGSLYNREAVVEFLLARSGMFVDDSAQHRYLNQLRASGLAFEHLQSTRDIFTVQLTEAPDVGKAEQRSAGDASTSGRFICPVTQLDCIRYPFSALAPCGHVFSDRALRQMGEGTCGLCEKAFASQDAIPINGTKDQVEALRALLPTRAKPAPSKKRKSKGKAEDGGRKHAKRDQAGAVDEPVVARPHADHVEPDTT